MVYVMYAEHDGAECNETAIQRVNCDRTLVIDYGLGVLFVSRVHVVLDDLPRHVHVTGISIRIGIIVRLLVCGVCHDCRVCWCRRLKRLSHRLRGVFNGISLRDIALSRAGTKARGT